MRNVLAIYIVVVRALLMENEIIDVMSMVTDMVFDFTAPVEEPIVEKVIAIIAQSPSGD